MKKLVIIMIIAAMLQSSAVVYAMDDSAKASIVFEPHSRTILYEKNIDERLPVASTTKIMTALIVLENCDLEESVRVKSEHAAVEGSSMYLEAGQAYSVRDLLYGLLLASGNDAALALADHAAGSVEAFAELMNEKCDELGLENTHFSNPHGLDAAGHYSSARDLALITAAAMENDTFREIFSAMSYTVNEVSYTNHNKLLKECPGCIGGKTGYTSSAGRVLVSCVEREGMELICVTISDANDWKDHIELYNWAFENYQFIPALSKELKMSVISGMSGQVKLAAACKGIVLPKGCDYSMKVCLPRFTFAPVLINERAGEVRYYADGVEYIVPVYFDDTVFLDGSIPLTPWERFKRAWYLSGKYGFYYPES